MLRHWVILGQMDLSLQRALATVRCRITVRSCELVLVVQAVASVCGCYSSPHRRGAAEAGWLPGKPALSFLPERHVAFDMFWTSRPWQASDRPKGPPESALTEAGRMY